MAALFRNFQGYDTDEGRQKRDGINEGKHDTGGRKYAKIGNGRDICGGKREQTTRRGQTGKENW